MQWFRCEICGFLFTSFFDDWSADDFVRFVYNADYILVDPEFQHVRPERMLEVIPPLLGDPSGLRLLDYGSGAGTFVKGLVARGYDAFGYDPFSSPTRPSGLFDIVTCFEVMEHCPDPVAVLGDMRSLLAEGGGILLGETLQPANIEETRCGWWYCAPRNGHCSTFTARSLAFAAERVGGLRFHPGGGRHAFTSCDGGTVAQLLESITGPYLTSTTFGAPTALAAPGWHHIEPSPSGPFRWTSQDCVSWQGALGAATTLEIRIPVHQAVRPDFLQDCRILVDGREAETRPDGPGLVAHIAAPPSANGRVTVELRTPAPQTPRELRGVGDDRRLGLAIGVL